MNCRRLIPVLLLVVFVVGCGRQLIPPAAVEEAVAAHPERMEALLDAIDLDRPGREHVREKVNAGDDYGAIAAPPTAHGSDQRKWQLDDAVVRFSDDELHLENARIGRHFQWNGGHLISYRIEDRRRQRAWDLAAASPDFEIPGFDGAAIGATLSVRTTAATTIRPAHLRVRIDYRIGGTGLRRECRVYPGTPAIGCTMHLRGSPDAPLPAGPTRDADRTSSTSPSQPDDIAEPVIDRLQLPGAHWSAQAIRFYAATDHRNTLVQRDDSRLYRRDEHLTGNVLRLTDLSDGAQLFVVKHSPAGADQLAWPGHDYALRLGDVRVTGLGFAAEELKAEAWMSAYEVSVGVSGPGDLAFLDSLRAYRETERRYLPDRDSMIVLNTWGDRSRDARMREDFVLAEIKAAAKLGITHLQLDDGWQAGLSKNSANAAGRRWADWSRDDWEPHPERFPNGLGRSVKAAHEAGIELGLWFNPSRTNDYEHWKRDADILIGLYREHGIRLFKIDGIEVPSKAAEKNLRRLLERVIDASDGEVVFNLDVTAGRRPGYFYFTEFGNLFLENRYTDWANYYPATTLRNLWQLAFYVPAQFLQIEFLNTWRNTDKYATDDPFAPAVAGFEYAFGVAAAAQPLAWFEASGLPKAAFETAPTVHAYRRAKHEWHSGRVFPIGDEPNGRAWTGFQSIIDDGDSGMLLVIREANPSAETKLRTWLPTGRTVRLETVIGNGESRSLQVGGDGAIDVSLPAPHSFALYRYRLQSQ